MPFWAMNSEKKKKKHGLNVSREVAQEEKRKRGGKSPAFCTYLCVCIVCVVYTCTLYVVL